MTTTIKVTDLPNAGVLSGTELVPIVQGGTTKQATTLSIAELFSGPGSGTVTSVGLSAPAIFSVSGSPVTASGTLALSLATQAANLIWGGPSTGVDATPTFRTLVDADLPVVSASKGGTGISSYAIGDILYASGATTLAKLADIATGNALISGGVGVAPSWGKIGLTTHISGVLPAANGGTGLSSYTIGDLVYASGASALSSLADIATGNVLLSGGIGVAPAYGKVGLTTHVSGTLAVTNGGTGVNSVTAYAVLCGGTGSSGPLQAVASVGSSGQALLSNGAGALPTFRTLSSAVGAALTRVDDTNVTLTLGGAPTTALLSAASITAGWTGQLAISRGGTGQGSASAAFDALAPTTTRGDLIFRNATTNTRLAASTSGYLLQANGAGTDPTWAGFIQSGTGAVTRTWSSKARDIVSAKDFGATGDGSTDDTTFVQAAIDAVAAAGGGTVLFPRGTYICTTLTLPDYVDLRGENRFSTVIKLKDSTNNNLIVSSKWASNSASVNLYNTISNLTLNGNKSNNSSGSCLIIRSFQAFVFQCIIRDAAASGIIISTVTQDGSNGLAIAENEIDTCRFVSNNGRAIYGYDNGTNTLSDAWIVNSFVGDNGDSGVFQVDIERAAGWHIIGCQFYSDYAGNVSLGKCGRTLVTNCQFELNARQASAGTSYTSLAIGLGSETGVILSNCHFHSARTDIATTTFNSINLSSTGSIAHITTSSFYTTGQTLPVAINRTAVSAATGYVSPDCRFVGYGYAQLGQGYVDIAGCAVPDGSASFPAVSFLSDPDTGIYRVAANTLGLAVAGAGEVQLTSSALSPVASDGNALGTTALMWADLFLASGGIINWNNGDVTLVHASNALTGSGGQFLWTYDSAAATTPVRFINTVDAATVLTGVFEGDRATPATSDAAYVDLRLSNGSGTQTAFGRIKWQGSDISAGSEDGILFLSVPLNGTMTDYVRVSSAAFSPASSDSTALGTTALMWSDLFLASGGVINWNNGTFTLTQSGTTLTSSGTLATADLTVTNTPRINQTPAAIGTGVKTISNAADSTTNFGKYLQLNMNGTTYYVPCSTVAPT